MRRKECDFKLYYGWVIVVLSFITLFTVAGVNRSFSVFYLYFLQDFGWSRSDIALAFSILMGVGAGLAPFAGSLVDRFRPRIILPISGLLIVLGLWICSGMSKLWQLYLSCGLISIGYSFLWLTPQIAILQRWFTDRLGFAFGIATAGIGIGVFITSFVAYYLAETLGWRNAFYIFAIFTLILIVALNAIFQRDKPPCTGACNDSGKFFDLKVLGKAVSKRWFWLIFAGLLCQLIYSQGVLVHIVVLLTDIGYERLTAALTLGLIYLVSSVGRILWGGCSDMFGRKKAYLLSSLLSISGFACLLSMIQNLSPRTLEILLIFALLWGLGFGSHAPLPAVIAADHFGGHNLGLIYGWISMGAAIGAFIGAWLPGYAYDLTGNHLLAVEVLIAMAVFTCIFFWFASKT